MSGTHGSEGGSAGQPAGPTRHGAVTHRREPGRALPAASVGEGPRAAAPGEVVLLPTEDEKAAAALLVDLAVVPVEHGLCTFKPVAGGADCPFGKQCHTCEHFVLTGADYNYWKRQEQRQAALAEGAPATTSSANSRPPEPTSPASPSTGSPSYSRTVPGKRRLSQGVSRQPARAIEQPVLPGKSWASP